MNRKENGTEWLGRVPVALLLLSVAACSGSGGGSGGTGGGTDDSSGQDNSQPVYTGGTAGSDPGFVVPDGQTAIPPSRQQINMAAAHARGGTGNGVTVAVVDTGVTQLPQFAGRWHDDPGIDVTGSGGANLDGHGHGTATASVILANRGSSGWYGVAPEATLLPVRLFDSFGSIGPIDTVDSRIAEATGYLANLGADIANNSWGSLASIVNVSRDSLQDTLSTQSYLNATRTVGDREPVIMVWAAGNESRPDPSVEAGLPHLFPGLQPYWLSVVAVDKNNILSDFSNACGVAAPWCIAAPGTLVAGLATDGGTSLVSGTSFSAPMVSGGLALLMQLFPDQPRAWYVNRLLGTAADIGPAGTDAIFGRGLLDLDAATRPVGATGIVTGGRIGSGVWPVNGSFIDPGPAFGDSLQRALAATRLTFFDSEGAPFALAMRDLVRRPAGRPDFPGRMRRFGRPFQPDNAAGPGDGTGLSYSIGRQPGPAGQDDRIGRLTVTAALGGGIALRFAWREALALNPVLPAAVSAHTRTAFASPYTAFAARGGYLAGEARLGDGITVTYGSFHGRHRVDGDIGAHGAVSALRVRRGPLTLALHAGAMVERDSLLGTRTAGAFGRDGRARTLFGGLAGRWAVTPGLDLFGHYNTGLTRASTRDLSLIGGLSTLRSDSLALGVSRRDVWRSGDGFSLVYSQPLRIAAGRAVLDLANGRNRDGSVNKNRVDVDLAPGGRERHYDLFYRLPLAATTDLATGASLRVDPGHVKDKASEALFMLRLNHRL